jgi:hypothetical protein
MLDMSQGLRAALSEGNALARAVVRLRDGTTLTLGGRDIMLGGATFSQATSRAQSFDVGAAVTGRCMFRLRNDDRHLNRYDFDGASFVALVGAVVDGETEWLQRGTYWVEPIETMGETVNMVGLDNMKLLERRYSAVKTKYPATLAKIAADACAACGVTLATKTFPHSGYTVRTRPEGKDVTCVDVIGWVAQVAGCFADMDSMGRLRIRWYNTNAWDGEGDLDGGTFDTTTTHYSDGDTADGGGFMTGGGNFDGGQFSAARYVGITDLRRITAALNDTTVTGVAVTAAGESAGGSGLAADGEQVLEGADGYVINVADNPLIEYGRAREVARMIGEHVNGMTFRVLTCSAISDPVIEAGDAILVTDRVQDTYRTYATHVTWSTSGTASVECRAEATSEMEVRKRSTPPATPTASAKATVDLSQYVKDVLLNDPEFRQAVWQGITSDPTSPGSWSGGSGGSYDPGSWSGGGGGGWSGGDWSGGGPIEGADGNWYNVGVDENGNVYAQMVPSAIEVVEPPDRTEYVVGDFIRYEGIAVRLLDGNGEVFTDDRYPDGMVPFNELTFPDSEARYVPGSMRHATFDTPADDSSLVYKYHGITFSFDMIPVGTVLFGNAHKEIKGFDVWRTYMLKEATEPVYACIVYNEEQAGRYYDYVCYASTGTFTLHYIGPTLIGDDISEEDIVRRVSDGVADWSHQAVVGKNDGLLPKTVGNGLDSWHFRQDMAKFGTGEYESSIMDASVQWASPYDGRVLEDTTEIRVKVGERGGFGGGGGGGAF